MRACTVRTWCVQKDITCARASWPEPLKKTTGMHCAKPSGDHRIMKVYKRDVEKCVNCVEKATERNDDERDLKMKPQLVVESQECRGPFVLGGTTRDRAATAFATRLDRRNGLSLGGPCSMGVVSAFPLVPAIPPSSVSQSGWTHNVRNISSSVGLSGISGEGVTSAVDIGGCRAASARLTDGGMANNDSSRTVSIEPSHTSSFADLPSSRWDISNGCPAPGEQREALKFGPNWFSDLPDALFW